MTTVTFDERKCEVVSRVSIIKARIMRRAISDDAWSRMKLKEFIGMMEGRTEKEIKRMFRGKLAQLWVDFT